MPCAPRAPEEIEAGRKRIQELYETRGEMADDEWEVPEGIEEEDLEADEELAEDAEDTVDAGANVIEIPAARGEGDAEIESLLERSRALLAKMHPEDREEAIDLHDKIDGALASGDRAALQQATRALKELLFFVEGGH